MKKALNRVKKELYYYVDGEKKIVDIDDKSTYPANITGDLSELTGDISGLTGNLGGLYGDISSGLTGNLGGLYGNISELTGDLSELTGDLSGLSGNCTNIVGDLNDCKLTEEDREKGVDIRDLIKEK